MAEFLIRNRQVSVKQMKTYYYLQMRNENYNNERKLSGKMSNEVDYL